MANKYKPKHKTRRPMNMQRRDKMTPSRKKRRVPKINSQPLNRESCSASYNGRKGP